MKLTRTIILAALGSSLLPAPKMHAQERLDPLDPRDYTVPLIQEYEFNMTNPLVMSNLWGDISSLVQTNATNPLGAGSATNLSNAISGMPPTNTIASTNLALSTNSLAPTNSLPPETNTVPETDVPESPATSPVNFTSIDYPSFRLISDRNIFNQSRSARRPYVRREYRRPARTESFALVGTMSYEKGLFAFFDGSSSEYKKVARPADDIAGFKVAEIDYNRVKLVSNTNEIELPIGMQLRREDEGAWTLAAQTGSYTSSSSMSSSTVASTTTAAFGAGASNVVTSSAPESAASGGESDVLKRLMQRREQELK